MPVVAGVIASLLIGVAIVIVCQMVFIRYVLVGSTAWQTEVVTFSLVTINMEIGLITPPVGLNLYVINGIVPDVPLSTILKGALPYTLCMVLAIILLLIFPQIATWPPDMWMGTAM